MVQRHLHRTQRLNLRYFSEESDREIFTQYRNDPELGKYQSWPFPLTEPKIDQFFREMRERSLNTENKWVQIALEEIETGILIGDCAFINSNNNIELGISIRREFQKRGFGYEGLNGLIQLLIEKVNPHRFIAIIDIDNIGSVRLFEKLKFRKEAHHIQSYWDEKLEEWRDEYVYALLRAEYT